MQSRNFFGFRLYIYLYIYIFMYIQGLRPVLQGLVQDIQGLRFRAGLVFFLFLIFSASDMYINTRTHTRVNLNSYKLGSKQEKKENPPFQDSARLRVWVLVSHTLTHTHSHNVCVGFGFFFYFFSPDQIQHTHVHVCTDMYMFFSFTRRYIMFRYVYTHTHTHTHTHTRTCIS